MRRITTLLMMALVILSSSCSAKTEPVSGNGNEENPSEYVKPEGYDSQFPWHAPMGRGVGAKPGRVVWAFAPECVSWTSGYWWETKNFDASTIRNMIANGISRLADKPTASEGWAELFAAHNRARGKGLVGYKPGEKIAIKVNMNGAGWSGPNDEHTQNSFTNPVALRELLLSMTGAGGIRAEDITVYDASRNIPSYMLEYVGASPLNKVNFQYSDEGGADDCLPDRSAPIVWSEQFSGETSYLPLCVTQAEYLINFANLKGHSMNGITLCAKNHFGSIINSSRTASPVAAGIHQFVTADAKGKYTVLVDLMGNKYLGPKTMLYLLDGIIVSPSEGSTTTINSDNTHWQQEPFNGGYTASLFFSQDPVAIDAVGADFLMNEPTMQRYNSVIRNNPNVENYLHEAASVGNAPSGTVYRNGAGEKISNLGVHEHWNNSHEKLYSRNLGKPEGIELIRTDGNANQPGDTDGKALIVYYSWSGNTRHVAEVLAKLVGADTYEILTVKNYPEDGHETALVSIQERNSGNLPALKGELPDLSSYSTVYLGAPIWNSYLPTPVEKWLELTDLSVKTLIPFSTSQGSGQSGFLNDLKKRARNPKEIIKYKDFVFPDNYSPDAFTDEQITRMLREWLDGN